MENTREKIALALYKKELELNPNLSKWKKLLLWKDIKEEVEEIE